jgi:DHA2 family multidrug resistance protein-like MFS transporter
MDMTVGSGAAPKAGRKEWIGLIVLALPTLLLSVDISVLYLALPHLSQDLNASAVQQLWIIDIYSFLTAGFLITMGNIGDRVGRRKLMLIGSVVFGAASIVAAYANSPELLIAMRALIGISAASLLPSALALLRNMFHNPQEMMKAMGIWFSCFIGGQAIGPVIGGVLLAQFWWGSVFLMGVPVMLLLLVAGPILLPEYKNPHAGKIDLTSVVLSLAAILPIIWGLKDLARNGWSTLPIVAIVVGVIIGALFMRRQSKLEHPLLELSLFKNKVFSMAMSVMVLAGVIMAGATLVAAIYLQMVKGLTPLSAGLLLVPQSIAMIISSNVTQKLTQKYRPAPVIAAGLAISALGLFVVSFVSASTGSWLLVVGMIFTLAGIALPMVVTGGLVMGNAPMEKAGSAAGMMETSGEFGVAVGVAVMGSIATLAYRFALPDAFSPGISGDAARESITSAVASASQLPAQLGNELVTAARDAYATGVNVVTGVGAVVFLVLAAISVAVLRRTEMPANPMMGPPPAESGADGPAADKPASEAEEAA